MKAGNYSIQTRGITIRAIKHSGVQTETIKEKTSFYSVKDFTL